MEPLLGIPIDGAWRPQIAAFLDMAASNADLYADLPLHDGADEQAPVFVPGQPAPDSDLP
jgi:hypothetical protein